METAPRHPEKDTGSCGRCEQCRCGKKGEPAEAVTPSLAAQAITTLAASVMAGPATDSRLYGAAGAAS